MVLDGSYDRFRDKPVPTEDAAAILVGLKTREDLFSLKGNVNYTVCISVKGPYFFVYFPFSLFLVACTRLYNPLCRSVRPSVCPSVRRSVTLYFFEVFAVFGLTAPAKMIE